MLPAPSEYLASNASSGFEPSGIATLFYPGAGTDYGPIRMTLESMYREDVERRGQTAFLSAYYVDYGPHLTLERIRSFLELELPRVLDPYQMFIMTVTGVKLSPEDFGTSIKMFFSPQGISQASEQDFFGLRYTYPSLRLSVTYLKSEALATLKVMTRKGIHPNIVVLQDHGYGDNWFRFYGGAASPLLKAVKLAPRYLYVGDNTEAWPHYSPVSSAAIDPGQDYTHPHSRQLFEYRKSRKT